MKVAVTGATGFVGQHVVRALLSKGVEVLATSRSAKESLTPSQNLRVANVDICDADRAADAFVDSDVLIHLAWSGLPNYQSEVHLITELPKQMEFLEACSRGGIKRLVVAGTCLEYGMRSGELDESLEPAPANPYAAAKQEIHEQLRRLAALHQIRLTWLRLFYLFGAGQAPSSLYSQLRLAVESGMTHFPMSPGDQLRDFLSVKIAAEVIATISVRDDAVGTVNVCSGQPVQVAELARRWIREWDSRIELDFGAYAYPSYEPFAFWGNANKMNLLAERS